MSSQSKPLQMSPHFQTASASYGVSSRRPTQTNNNEASILEKKMISLQIKS